MKALNRLVDRIAVALFAGILLLVNLQIVCRFVLSISVPWTEEVSRLVFIWLAYIGAAIGLREGTLIVIDTLPQVLGSRAEAIVAPVVRIVSLLVIVLLFAGS